MSDKPSEETLTPAERIIAEAAAGKLTHEQATLQLLGEIAEGVWYMVANFDELMEMARDSGESRGRVH